MDCHFPDQSIKRLATIWHSFSFSLLNGLPWGKPAAMLWSISMERLPWRGTEAYLKSFPWTRKEEDSPSLNDPSHWAFRWAHIPDCNLKRDSDPKPPSQATQLPDPPKYMWDGKCSLCKNGAKFLGWFITQHWITKTALGQFPGCQLGLPWGLSW